MATAILVVYWSVLLLATHWPRQIIPEPGRLLASDKLLHFSAYTGLGFLFLLVAFLRHRITAPLPLPIFVGVALLASAAGFIDEATQPLFGRDFEWYDWCADTVGGMVAQHYRWRCSACWPARGSSGGE